MRRVAARSGILPTQPRRGRARSRALVSPCPDAANRRWLTASRGILSYRSQRSRMLPMPPLQLPFPAAPSRVSAPLAPLEVIVATVEGVVVPSVVSLESDRRPYRLRCGRRRGRPVVWPERVPSDGMSPAGDSLAAMAEGLGPRFTDKTAGHFDGRRDDGHAGCRRRSVSARRVLDVASGGRDGAQASRRRAPKDSLWLSQKLSGDTGARRDRDVPTNRSRIEIDLKLLTRLPAPARR